MSRRSKRIAWAIAICAGFVAILVAASMAWFSISDRTNGSIVSSGVTRRYLLYVPKSYDPARAAPLVISIHPAATWGSVQMTISRWNELADEKGFIVVYPDGSGAFFGGFGNGPHVWPMEAETLPRDVGFISDLIDKLEADYHVDPRRIYVDGMSNGGGMAFALSCALPDRIAAIGAVASAQSGDWDSIRRSKPVPTVAFHGTADKFAPYYGGRSPIAPRPFPNIREWTARVAQRNGCKESPMETRITPAVRRLAYAGCAENAAVVLYTIEGGGHTWPGGAHLAEWIAGKTTDEISATRVMWEFFSRHPLHSSRMIAN